jgi:hypothetical protein
MAAGTVAALGCGGDVTVYHGGTGGAGGASTSSSGTTGGTNTVPTGSTMSTGCSCEAYCQVMVGCAYRGKAECPALCSSVDPWFRECVCQVGQCWEIDQCGAGGAPPRSPECQDCLDSLSQGGGPCEAQMIKCAQDPGCEQLGECNQECGWTPSCATECAQAYPGSYQTFAALVQCAVCAECPEPCASSQVYQSYCYWEG